VYIPYVKGVSEKFKCIGKHYDIGPSSKLNTVRHSLMKTRPERDPQQMAHCIYSIVNVADAALAKQADI
jgi:hypothetical protein